MFSNFLEEDQKEPIKMEDLNVIILGKGDQEGTFADMVKKAAKPMNIKNTLVEVDEAFISSKDIEIGEVTIRNIDGEDKDITINVENTIIFVRAGALHSLTAQALVSSLQTVGFFLINDLESMLLCDNKMSSAIALERGNINIPRTSIVNNVKSIEEAHKNIGGKFPVIIKTLTGTQGVGVSKVNDMASLVSVCQSLWKFNADVLLQEFLDIRSDVRTLLLNGKIVASAERVRKSEGKEFRNNVHLGADTLPYELSEEEKDLVVSAARATRCSYCGVDHARVGKELYILEVNGSPGIRSHFMGYDLETGESTRKINALQVITDVILFFTEERRRRPLMRQEVGFIESIVLDGLEDNPIRAKFDTGNSASATMLHVDSMKLSDNTVVWKKNGKSFESEVLYVSEPKRGLKEFDRRPVIEHGVTFNNRKYTIELGLSEKDTASEMLVNRKSMTQFGVSVHPNRLFVVSNVALKNDASDH